MKKKKTKPVAEWDWGRTQTPPIFAPPMWPNKTLKNGEARAL